MMSNATATCAVLKIPARNSQGLIVKSVIGVETTEKMRPNAMILISASAMKRVETTGMDLRYARSPVQKTYSAPTATFAVIHRVVTITFVSP